MDAAPDTAVDPRPGPTAPALADGSDAQPLSALGRTSVALAAVALVCFLVALVLAALPVRTPGVQDCGAPAAYLAAGRLDVVPDAQNRILGPDGEPRTLDEETARTARDQPCRQRVADRAVPAGGLVLVGTLLGLTAFALEFLVVRPPRRRAWRAAVMATARPPVAEASPVAPPPTTSPWPGGGTEPRR